VSSLAFGIYVIFPHPFHPPPPVDATWLYSLRARIHSARISTARAASRELILLYWDLARGIVEKQQPLGWGKAVVERLSTDLQAEIEGIRCFS
jgi:hypothetical protein